MRPSRTLLTAALLAAALAACSQGVGAEAPAGTGAPSAMPQPTPPAVTGSPASPAALLPGPPAAYLAGAGLGDPGAAGAEGSFTWDGAGSDAPWIVQPDPVVRGPGPWIVRLDPPLPVTTWSARWARIASGSAGDPEAAATGSGSTLVVQAPGVPGSWSLQVQASFGVGRQAAWYWTVDVLP